MDDPRTRMRRGLERLAVGDYAEGFRLYEAWREAPEHRAVAAGAGGLLAAGLKIPVWDGGDLAGRRLLILSEEGFGDQIMYARFAKLAQARAAEVVWLCTPALARLFNRCLGVRAVGWDEGADLGAFDLCIPSSALASRFFPPLEAPPPAPYLATPPASVVPGLSVGVVAAGSPTHGNDRNRSLPTDLAAELLALPGAVSLDPATTGARDFYDTACVIAGLDLVISVDTAAAHLTGALGRPGFVMLPAEGTDWRWGRAGETSPWYASLRLFRQPEAGAWRPVLDSVRAAIGER